MTKFSLVFLAFFLILMGCKKDSDPVSPSPTTGTIIGKVTSAGGDSVIVGASITTSPITSTVTTDAKGQYTISNVSVGVYTITAIKIGYNAGNTTVIYTTGQISAGDIKMGVIVNHSPETPVLISPASGSTGQARSLTLTWSCADSDGDSLSYDVYLDKTSLPTTKVASALAAKSYTASNLDSASIYYWKIIAKDSKGAISTASVVYSFATKNLGQGLLIYYPLNGNVKDMSGNAYDAVNHGATLTSDRFGNQNSAYSFDGNSYLTSPDQLLTGLTAFTITAWVKPTGSTSGTIVYKGTQSGECRMALDNGKAIFVVGLTNGSFYTVTSNSTIALNKDYQITARYIRGSQIEIWVNGVLENSVALPSFNLKQTNETSSSIGAYNFNSTYKWFFSGTIDDVRIYNRLLSGSEIQSL